MKDITRQMLAGKSFEIYRNGQNKAYLLSLPKEAENIESITIKYELAEKLQRKNIFLQYSPSMANACMYQFVTPYMVIDKAVDELGNIIIVGERMPPISLKVSG
jgi:hypothetical protein